MQHLIRALLRAVLVAFPHVPYQISGMTISLVVVAFFFLIEIEQLQGKPWSFSSNRVFGNKIKYY